MKYFILFALFLLSCTPQLNYQSPQVYKGFEGIVMYGVRDAPPTTVIEGTASPLLLRVENRGAYNVEFARYFLDINREYISMSSEDQFNVEDTSGTFSLEGKSLYNPMGGSDIISRQLNIKSLKGPQQSATQRIQPILCYPYETAATVNVCIDSDPFNPLLGARPKTCMYEQPISLPLGQGAPIAVTSVQSRMIPIAEGPNKGSVRPEFVITIENRGTGQIIRQRDYMDACVQGAQLGDIGIVEVRGVLSDSLLNCTAPKWNTKDPSTTIHCQLEDPNEIIPPIRGTYTALLQLTVKYGYYEYLSPITFTIVKAGR